MLSRAYYKDIPKHNFPYADGEYIWEDKDQLGFARAFKNAATIANPLAPRSGTHREIGRHIEMKVNASQTSIVMHKGAPPKAIKILASQLKGHVRSLLGGHCELFLEVGHKLHLIMSFQRLAAINVRELAHWLLSRLKASKHYLRLFLKQTDVGGALNTDAFHSSQSIQTLLSRY